MRFAGRPRRGERVEVSHDHLYSIRGAAGPRHESGNRVAQMRGFRDAVLTHSVGWQHMFADEDRPSSVAESKRATQSLTDPDGCPVNMRFARTDPKWTRPRSPAFGGGQTSGHAVLDGSGVKWRSMTGGCCTLGEDFSTGHDSYTESDCGSWARDCRRNRSTACSRSPRSSS
jgi:hypothetical protein